MKINIVTIAYNLPESSKKLFETAMLDSDKHDISFQLFLHSRHEPTIDMCDYLTQNFPCTYYPHGTNRGLSLSWNDGILYAYDELKSDVIIIANDDVAFEAGDIDKIAQKAVSNRDNYMVSVAGFNATHGKVIPSNGYSCFALNPIGIEKIGMFDENIFPIYGEDVDHHRRAHLLGLVEANCSDTKIYHTGSSAVKKDPMLGRQNMVTQSKNRQYIFAKWSTEGLDGGYKHPFNNRSFGLYISPEDRHAPYPGYNRDDRFIVRF